MNILLLNNNPVVNKLVTLSAQKTSNALDSVQSIDEVESKRYDLLIIDDELYSEEVMDELSNRVEYKKSLYICSKDAKLIEGFTRSLKKPFLPTDLVELFISLSKEESVAKLEVLDDDLDFLDKSVGFDVQEDIESIDFDELDSLDEDIQGRGVSKFDDFDIQEDVEFDDLEDGLLEDELDFDDTDVTPSSKVAEGVLDKEELQEVQNLLDETETEDDDIFGDFDLEDDLELAKEEDMSHKIEDDTLDDDFSFDDMENDISLGDLSHDTTKISVLEGDDFDLQDEEDATQPMKVSAFDDEDDFSFEEEMGNSELSVDETEEEPLDNGVSETSEDEDFSFDEEQENLLGENMLEADETQAVIEEDFDDATTLEEPHFDEKSDEFEDLESQIESAVKDLSDEDLESEVDEEMLLDIDSLTSRDLKLAIGEEVEEEEFMQSSAAIPDEDVLKYEEQEQQSVSHKVDEVSHDGVEALKKLLKALSNEDVAASLKGMKININITLGDSQ